MTLTGVTFFVLYKQLSVMRKQVENEDKHFQLDERPILSSDDDVPGPVLTGVHFNTTSNQLIWNYIIKNYGKSTAFNIKIYEYMSVFGGNFKNKYEHPPKVVMETVPSQKFWSTVYYAGEISAEDALRARNTDGAIYVKIVLRYDDAQGKTYESQLCFQQNANGTVGRCLFSQTGNIPTEDPPPPLK